MKEVKIHKIDSLDGWVAEFLRTEDGHLQIVTYPRYNESLRNITILYNVTTGQLLDFANAIYSKSEEL